MRMQDILDDGRGPRWYAGMLVQRAIRAPTRPTTPIPACAPRARGRRARSSGSSPRSRRRARARSTIRTTRGASIARSAAQARGAAVRIAGAAARSARHADGAARHLPHLEDAAADGRRHLRAVRPHRRAHAHAHALLPVPPRGEPGAARCRRAHRPARRRAPARRPARCRAMLGSVGVSGDAARRRDAAASRWVPLAGAAAVGGYAYWDTLQVAKTARRLLGPPIPVRRAVTARLTAHVRPLRAAHPSGGDRAGVRAAAAAAMRAALQHRADAAGAVVASARRRRARAASSALGPRAALGEGSVDRREDDQRARRDDRRQAVVPHRVPPPSLPAFRPTASTSGRRRAGGKQPMHIGMKDGAPFGFAGLFERWLAPDGEVLDTCTIVTTHGQCAAAADARAHAGDRRARATTRAGSTPPISTLPTCSRRSRPTRWRGIRCRRASTRCATTMQR